MKHFSKQKGVSLYIAIIIIVILLAIVLGTGAILLGQLKVMKGMEDSIVAFYAADTGIEKILKERNDDPLSFDGTSETLDNGARYYIEVKDDEDSDCDASNFCIRSVGEYKGTKRAIEVVY